MSLWKQLLARLGARRERTDEFNRELQAHLELEAEMHQESGLSPEDSRYAAVRAFGNATRIAEDVRAVWSFNALETFARDLRYGARTLRKNPAFTAVAVLSLALGIGANTAIFSATNALLLLPLPFPHADRIVRIYSTKAGGTGGSSSLIGPSPLDIRDFSQANHTFEKIVIYDYWRKNVSYGNPAAEPEQMRVGLVPAEYFEVLGVQPVMGRLFTDEENHAGTNFVAAITASLWRTRYAADPAILGRKILINDEPYTIVAVMPDVIPEWLESWAPGLSEVWTPFAIRPDEWSEGRRGGRGDAAIGRLKPGVSLDQAQADLSAIAAALAAAHPIDQGIGVAVRPVADTRVGKLRPMLLLLMGAVCLILLIACVNLANLLLARNSARQRELAVRSALGAGRPGLVRQLLAETLLLSLAGAALGLALAHTALAALARMRPGDAPQLASISMDWRVLLFTLLVSLSTSLLFGLAPALTATRLNLVDALKQGGRSAASGPRGLRMRNLLVASEMAMSLMLLVAASLLVQSILRLDRQPLGIRQDHLLKGHFYLPGVRYPDAGALTRFCDDFARRVRALPGVVDATVTTIYPPSDRWTQMLGLPGRPATQLEEIPTARFGLADAHFLKTLGLPLLRGRDFAESDTATSPIVALISEEFRLRYFPAEDPIGRTIHIGPPEFLQIPPGASITDSADVTIIGVVGDFRNAGVAVPPDPQITVLYAQHPLVNYGFKDMLIRTAAEPRSLASAIRGQLHQLDPDMPFAEVQTMDELVVQQTGGQRLTTALLASFAAGGLALAAIGIYGVISFLVVQRRQELAVRLAIGSTRPAAFWLVLKQGLGMAASGAAVGLLGAAGTQTLFRGLLFGIGPLDPLTFAAGTAFLLAVAATASAIPGARVLQIDPARTLRQD